RSDRVSPWHLLIRCCRSRTNRSPRICADPDQVVPAEHDLGTSTPNPNAVRLSTHVTRVLGAKLCSDSRPASREDCGGVVRENGGGGVAERRWRKPDATVMVATFGRFRGLRFHVRPTQMLESSLVRASGGIGRRAGFRCQWPQGRGGSSPPSRTANEEPLTAACRRSGEGLLRARRPEPGTGWLGPARALAALRARSSGSADFAPSTVRWMRSRLNESSMTALPLEWELPLERE